MTKSHPHQVFLLFVLFALATSPAGPQTSTAKPSFVDVSRRAASAREAGDVPQAINLYQQALRLNAEWQEGWFYLGSLQYDSNQYGQAATSLRRLTKLNSKMAAAWALLGLSEFETEDFPSAFSQLQKAHALGIDDSPELGKVADYHLGLLLNLRGQADAARSLLSKLMLRGVNSEDLQVALGLSLLRVPLLPKQLDPSKDALVHEAGNVAAMVARHEYEQADVAFRDLLAKYPDTPFIHYAYGSMLAKRGQEEAAITQLKAETAVTPDSALAYMEWAFLEFNAQHYTDALPVAQTAVKLAPNASMAHYLLGSILLAQDATVAAIPHLETARHLAPSSPEVRYSLARAYAKVGKRDLARREQDEFTRLQAQGRSPANNAAMDSLNPENASGAGTGPAPQ